LSDDEKLEHRLMPSAFDSLLRGDGKELDAYLAEVSTEVEIIDTKAKIHCYALFHDGNERPRMNDLAKAVAARAMEYAIPRSEINKARDFLINHNSPSKFAELQIKARKLFTPLKKTGEGGEMLLYMLAQGKLRLPQVLCKMSLKTSSNLHYNGADALHMGYDKKTDELSLYWGESKLYQSVSTAITDCLDSIKPFICDEGGTDTRQDRDLQLLSNYLDLDDKDVEDVLLRYLNPDDPLFNSLVYKGVCLIGFDEAAYPSVPNSKKHQEVVKEIEEAFMSWQDQLGKKLKDRSPLHTFELEVFLLPLPSVDEFRKSFLGEMNFVK
jgi:hypothetical protein